MAHLLLLTIFSISYIAQCALVPKEDRMVRVRLQFHADLPRLDNFGLPVAVPDGHAGQNPQFGNMSIHWVELVENYLTAVGAGEVIYSGTQYEYPDGRIINHTIIDHTEAIIAGADQYLLNIPLKDITPGTYQYIRASVSYQEFKASFNLNNNINDWILNNIGFPSGIKQVESGSAWIQSFTGVNTYIATIYNQQFELVVNAEKLQGFWTAAETFNNPILNDDTYANFKQLRYGQLPAGTTTVPNPLWQSAETPPGSCVVVGQFVNPLLVPGSPLNNDDNENDIGITLRISVNQSLEWIDYNQNGEWDLYFIVDENETVLVPNSMQIINESEPISDMGTRGLWPLIENLQREYIDSSITNNETTTALPTDNANRFKIIVGVVFIMIFCFM